MDTRGYNPDKFRCVDIPDGREFANETKFIWGNLFHELSHAYHHQVLGYDHPEIKKLYTDMKASGKYDKVLRIFGNSERHYALNNSEEYFAESMETYFLFNDYYPFNRAELRLVDPAFCKWVEEHFKEKTSTPPHSP